MKLYRFRREDSSIKSVIFSQWVSMLDLVVKPALEREGFSFVSLDGKMSRQQRDESIRSFQADPSISVFVVSLQAGNLGITLTAACKIFILDVWFNPVRRLYNNCPPDVNMDYVSGC